eukprot:1158262-Pelagomonas_calceolata.AAC.1
MPVAWSEQSTTLASCRVTAELHGVCLLGSHAPPNFACSCLLTCATIPCTCTRAATSSKLFARLKNKRFNQIFDYLDEDANGLLDVVGLVRNSTEHMDNLDIEVRGV